MCGIVGYIGDKQAQSILTSGLAKLEYRGYDSAGVAVLNDDHQIQVEKKKGRLSNLEAVLKDHPLRGTAGIGHTRWATHGEPSDANAHPHLANDGKIAVVHNGIIENYIELKEKLIAAGHRFVSDTDTEVIAHLLGLLYDGNLVDAVVKAVKEMKGSYSLGIMCADEPDKIIAVRKNSPLIVGLGEGENFIASDIPAILDKTRDVYLLDDDEIAVLTKDDIRVVDRYGETVGKQIFKVTWEPGDAEKGGYAHFMLKEINEQPKAIRDCLTGRLLMDHIQLDDVMITKEDLENIDHIQIVACGTAYHAGLIGKYYIEKYARIPVEAETGSEYRYKHPIVTDRTMLIVLSQSGETADTLAAIRLAKTAGARVVAVTNVVGSSVAREASDVLYTNAGPEIAVASTKAYVTQIACMLMFALHISRLTGTLSDEKYAALAKAFSDAPARIEQTLKQPDRLKELALQHFKVHDAYFIGRGIDAITCMEGSLKMKEVSYIHSDAYQAGELKHGPIALIEPGTLIIALCTQDDVFEKTLSNIKEVKSRGAYVLAIAQAHHQELASEVDEAFFIPDEQEDIAAMNAVVYLQLFAYYLAVARGCDVDKPKNLAKSVTVE
ncbi:glutamine--fructose-6-phosphate transaminase (isomerizing) [Pseudoramibacter faecis]|uniref:glutamine--fructose-6-phosphate transaminase (isomerizing) n=1 Tax=Pseudoramibacter faecis TaxID=3108534 RepID=UPI002E771478|nr:glutamine--fructose-6-phosphate transaminase (isomerizing) [Pseudoramibacter sp. HA2172]